ncbi:hypothetical protein [Mucilaginibacter sp. FT3.2]|uniref:hypothetical protein n=1 Tax=Mucilaginibacter sp. FT3.2 TaxID=2723090 RepID=UPI00161BF84D|nr:hypothetical protein [Mucilaginibacter sp. FT3.2]MBB6234324.1 hypothetical protein [Mucilaginibacter sp. FT3.2]
MKTPVYLSVRSSFLKSFFTCVLCIVALSVFAQDKTKTIGNKSREGSSNTSFSAVKGEQVGIQMNAGHKHVQLLKLNFHVANHANDSVAFKVNVYKMNGKLPVDSNLVSAIIKGIIPKYKNGEHQLVSVDLSPYNVVISGDILVSIEFLTTKSGADISFACGLLNGGTFHKDTDTAKWKKIPVVGADFNVLVKKLK